MRKVRSDYLSRKNVGFRHIWVYSMFGYRVSLPLSQLASWLIRTEIFSQDIYYTGQKCFGNTANMDIV